MSLNDFPFARTTCVALVAACATLAGPSLSALGQTETPAQSPPDSAPTTPKPEAVIRHIVVHGTQRIEPGTVLSYVSVKEGDTYDPVTDDRSVKTLFATGLFADVKTNWDGSTYTIDVVENPIINQVVFEGNDKVSEKDLTKEVQLKPRM